MENVPAVRASDFKQPVFIEFTPSYEREHGISREIDNFNSLERTPDDDCYNPEMCRLVGTPVKASLKMPSPKKVTEAIAVIPVILETGKKILIGIFDLRDTWNERTGSKEHNLQAVVLPDEVAEKFDKAA